ncbi:MAG: bifunctional SulP family inorganic anion transporter/carbonic anhydrase [Chitinophagaceae bacterium]|nr:bifunctional SulP family inorganic anion transporter/carbonic anhydrase [Chitinophagaceae bacterium]
MINLKSLKSDFPASIVVFLVALPLCLGVALASGAPLFSGLVSGIIGGVVVGIISKSSTSVSGPAAGLAAVVLASIAQLGNFELFLTALVIAGIIQLIMGFAKAGFIANYIPNNVIKGLLAAIGIILILKQIPHAIGFDKDPDGEFSFFQPDGENTFSELLKAFDFITPGAIIISFVSFLILLFWDKTPMGKIKFIPSSLIVVLVGALLNIVFNSYFSTLQLNAEHMVSIPKMNFNDLGSYFHLPNLASLSNPAIWTVALTIAIIASLETLLNIEAVDKLDPHKRETPTNREMIAQGIGNITAGFFGGIPVTSVVVRSSVNINAGNETKLSAILHGVFLLISVLALSSLMNLIPLSALAVILIFTGYKLANIGLFKAMYSKGWEQFIPFIVTILAIVFTDLLIGVLIGLAVSIFYVLRSNFRNPFVKENNLLHIGEVIKIELPNQVSFLNKASIKDTLWNISENQKVIIDASYSNYIDDDILEIISDFKEVVAPERNIQLNIIGLKSHYELKNDIQFINVLDKETVSKLNADRILAILKEGNQRFVSGNSIEKYYQHQVNITSDGQNPMAVIIGCIDSRTSPEILFDAGLGELLTIRLAGNIISPEVIGSIEIAVKKLGAKLIVVKGHSNCGAVGLALANMKDDNMHTITNKIQQVAIKNNLYPLAENESVNENLEQVVKVNAKNSVEEILNASPFLKSKIENNEIGIVSAYHDLKDGIVYFNEMNKY